MKFKTITFKNVSFTIPAGYRKLSDYAYVCRYNLKMLSTNSRVAANCDPDLAENYRATIKKLESVGL